MDDADILVGQHHGILLGIGKGSIDFRMSVVVMARQVQRLFVEWCRDSAVHFVGHGQFDGFLDVLEGCIATLCLYLSEFKGRKVHTFQVDDVDGAVFELGIADATDGIDLQIETKQLDGLAHDGSIARNNGTAFGVGLLAIESTNGNLRANACRVAHGDGKDGKSTLGSFRRGGIKCYVIH